MKIYFADFIRNNISGNGDFAQLRKGRFQKMKINGCLNYLNIIQSTPVPLLLAIPQRGNYVDDFV